MKKCDLKSMPIVSIHKSDAIARPLSVTWKSEIELCQHESVSAFSTPCLTNKEVTPGIREEHTARDRHKNVTTSVQCFTSAAISFTAYDDTKDGQVTCAAGGRREATRRCLYLGHSLHTQATEQS